MFSPRTVTAVLAIGSVLACFGTASAGQDRATPQEVIQRVQQAAQDVARSGEAGLATFSSKNTTSVWKDSYIFVLSCEGGTAVGVANPLRPEPMGTLMAQILTFGPQSGEQIAADFCAVGQQPHGGWVEYNFPKPGATQATRKVSYLLAAEGTPYVVGAGLYDEKAKVEDLDRLAASSSRAPAARVGAGSAMREVTRGIPVAMPLAGLGDSEPIADLDCGHPTVSSAIGLTADRPGGKVQLPRRA